MSQENAEIQIHNCHTHLFTFDHFPRKYFGKLLWFSWLVKNKLSRTIIIFIMGLIKHKKVEQITEMIPRLAAFLKVSERDGQVEVFEKYLQHYYPSSTRFVVLPMDFTHIGYGEPKIGIEDQMTELANLRDRYPDQIIPFVHIDPRNELVEQKVKDWVICKQFKGVKIYPAFGYYPTDLRLNPVFDFCEHYKGGIPVMTHCSGAIVRSKEHKDNKNEAISFGAPRNYIDILKAHPKLRLCLGHCGGDGAWSAYLNKPNSNDRQFSGAPDDSGMDNWLHEILEMLRSEQFDNLFVDISYVIFHYRENAKILKVLLEDSRVRSQVLFGTDFYMVELEDFSEKQLSMFLRATIGRKYFNQIAEINPKRYLFGD